MTAGVAEHFLLLRDDVRQLQAQQLITRDVGVQLPFGEAKVGVDATGGRHLLVPVSADAPLREDRRSAALTIRALDLAGEGTSVRYADLACHDSKLELVYERLVEDVLGRIEKDPQQPIPAIHKALHDWRALLAPSGAPLDRESLLGLVGELTVLNTLLAAGDATALDAWKGPAGGIHDFERGGCAIEVKASTSVDGKTVTISNLDQLDSSAVHSLHLVAVHLRESVKGDSVDDLMRAGMDLGADHRELISLVAKCGYVFESGVLDAARFSVRAVRAWHVDDDFPGLRRQLLSRTVLKGVSRVRYDLDLDACPGEVTNVDVGQLWVSMGETQ